jgi:hypothetical protein
MNAPLWFSILAVDGVPIKAALASPKPTRKRNGATGVVAEWSDAEREMARALRAQGYSTAKIALALSEAFKTNRTRNAVIGYLHRSGLSSKRLVSSSGRRIAPPQPAICKARVMGAHTNRPARQVRGWPIPRGPMATWFVEAKPSQCRFPLWADDAPLADKFVCGEPIEPGKPYCPACCANAFTGKARVAK